MLIAAVLVMSACDFSVVNIDGDDFDPGGRVVDRPAEEDGPEAPNPNFEVDGTCKDAEPDPGPAVVRRLTNLEYLNTIHDLLGVDAYDLAGRLPEESRVEGFRNAASGLTASGPLIDQYGQIATRVASRLDTSNWLTDFDDCQIGDSTCEHAFVRHYGALFFRRPTTDEEVERYGRLFRVVQSEGDDFERGARLVVEAMLQSPQFLYRLESADDDVEVPVRRVRADEFEITGLAGVIDGQIQPNSEMTLTVEHEFEPGEYRVSVLAGGAGSTIELQVGEASRTWELESDAVAPWTETIAIEDAGARDVSVRFVPDAGNGAAVDGVDITGPLDRTPEAGAVTGHDGVRRVTDLEMASRLSYFIWHSAPDRQLIDAAERGELHTDEQLRAQVERMLAAPRARRAFRSYIGEWLHLDYLDTAERDAELYPRFDRELVAEMKGETLSLFEHVAWDAEKDMTSVFVAERTWAGPRLAQLYGLPERGEGTSEYDLSDNDKRSGLLTHAGFLAVTTPNDVTSPVRRGLFVRTHLMCQPVAPPPPDLATSAPQIDTSAPKRKIFEQHSKSSACNDCHSQMDPIGFGFEHYDAIGGWRTHDLSGAEVTDLSYLKNGEHIDHFAGPTELAEILAESQAVENCMVQKVYQYATGRPPDSGDACDLRQVRSDFRAEGRTYHALVEAVVLSDAFRHARVHKPETADEEAP
ncbi:MAG: DUF1592 domain-containing protein [Myxococcota bacterium]